MSKKAVVGIRSAFNKIHLRPSIQWYTFAHDKPFVLESGKRLGPITVAYEAYGKLNEKRDNTILIPHALTGDSHCASHPEDPEPGWWEAFVGPGRAIDTDRYFVICANVLGGCQGTTGPSEIEQSTGKPYGMRFPIVTINDMVRVQRELLRHLNIDHLYAVIGGSMGGMQALEWAVAYPEMVGGLVPIATPGRSSPQAIAYNEAARRAIVSDPKWRGGSYYDAEGPTEGLGIARMIGMITYQSDESMWSKFGRDLMHAPVDAMYEFSTQFQVESYLHYQGKKLVNRFDANSYLYLTRAVDLFDLGRGRGGYDAALARIKAPTVVVGISSDILYPPKEQREIVEKLKKVGTDASYKEIDCPYGHDGFLIEAGKMSGVLSRFLKRLEN